MGCGASTSKDASVPWADDSQLTFVIHEKGCCDGGSVGAPQKVGPCSENEFATIRGLLRPGDNTSAIVEIPAQYPHLSAVATDQRFLPGRTGGYFEHCVVVTKVGYVDAPTNKVSVTVPAGAAPGRPVVVQAGSFKISAVVPADLVEGQTWQVDVPILSPTYSRREFYSHRAADVVPASPAASARSAPPADAETRPADAPSPTGSARSCAF